MTDVKIQIYLTLPTLFRNISKCRVFTTLIEKVELVIFSYLTYLVYTLLLV